MTYTATYSPEDNKLRLYSSTRLDRELYARVRGAGFIYAPKQELFVAPMWTPEREDLLIELCGEIDDEDTSLVERAEERADRFVDYKDKRIGDAERAQEAVSRIADNIPLGQPILIGHHSERHARKDAERIENGMRKTVKMWHTAKYWEDRAKGALRHAKYKELPGVRHRRIKGLEADLRRYQNSFTPDPKTKPQMWDGEEHVWITNGSRGGRWAKSSSLPAIEQQSRRWIEHLQNRIAYEKAMLGEAGGIAAAQFTIEVGGRVLVADEWVVVLKLNRAGGTLNSISTTPLRHWHGSSTKIEIERVKDYRAPGPGDIEKVKAATKLPPLCNYPGEGFAQMTQAEWDKKHKDYKTTRAVDATATHARHRVRHAMTTGYKYGHIFITDAKRVDPPAAPLAPADPEVFAREKDLRQGTDVSPSMEMSRAIHAAIPKDDRIPSYEQLHEMGKAAAAGVQVVIAPQLFPTPPELADRMVALADIRPGQQVLEPSAGTGRIIDAIRRNAHGYAITAVELNCNMAHRLRTIDCVDDTRQADFLECNGDLGTFDRIVMNPPFSNADDIKHIMHALKMLKPGGRLVAICANGPRQNDKLRPIVEARGGIWEELPSDTFISTGTSVRTVLLMLDA
ncbi:DUF3560 domain-containing protein (plasmid) [Tunturiibacter empetritectus]